MQFANRVRTREREKTCSETDILENVLGKLKYRHSQTLMKEFINKTIIEDNVMSIMK